VKASQAVRVPHRTFAWDQLTGWERGKEESTRECGSSQHFATYLSEVEYLRILMKIPQLSNTQFSL
jgi:hypothetical protein